MMAKRKTAWHSLSDGRIQVIAPGFRTYGEDFSMDQPLFVNGECIKLQKPAQQLSIYKIVLAVHGKAQRTFQQHQGVYLLDITARGCHFWCGLLDADIFDVQRKVF